MPSYRIYRRKKDGQPVGNWLARAYLGGDDYREEFTTLGTTDRAEAEVRAARWYADLLDANEAPGPGTLSALLHAFRETDQYTRLAHNTRRGYDRAWAILLERLGPGTPIRDVDDAVLRGLKDDLLDDYAQNSVRMYFGAPYSKLFRWAVAKGWIDSNPLDLVATPALEVTPSYEREAFTDEQMDAIFDAAPSTGYLRLWAVYRWTGCRTSEGLNLERDHIHRDEGWLLIDGTKNRNAKRTMPILPPLQPHLARLPRGNIYGIADDVFGARRVLAGTGKRLGIEPCYPKMFRRAFISRMRRQTKIPGPIWRRWVGHGSDALARDHYDAQDLEWERSLVE